MTRNFQFNELQSIYQGIASNVSFRSEAFHRGGGGGGGNGGGTDPTEPTNPGQSVGSCTGSMGMGCISQ